MPTNANGWPYPVGTDKVIDGDNAIKALADALPGRGGVEVTATDSVTVPNAAWSGVSVGTAGASYGAGWRTDATSPIIDVPGWWQVDLSVTWAAGGIGRRGLGWGAAGVAPTAFAQQIVSVSGTGTVSQVTQKWSGAFYFAAASRCQLWVYHDSGATISVTNRRIAIRRVF